MIKLILGGNKSGKSTYAEKIASEFTNVVYIATSVFLDNEMKKKIEIHKNRRPENWKTVEEGYDLLSYFQKVEKGNINCFLIDCLTVYTSNLICKNFSDEYIINHVKKFLNDIVSKHLNVIFVSNEVGLSVINENKLARRFAELAGILNQIIAEKADEVYFCIAGIPQKIK